MRRKQVSLLIFVAFVSVVSLACVCDRIDVENRTHEGLLITTHRKCDAIGDAEKFLARERYMLAVSPGQAGLALIARDAEEPCIVAIDPDTHSLAWAPVKGSGKYQVSQDEAGLRIQSLRPANEATKKASGNSESLRPYWPIPAAVFAAGGIVALYITARFFWRFYRQA
jgi:hypothetical protein